MRPILTVSLTGIGQQEYRIQIPMEVITESLSKWHQEETPLSSPISGSGMSLKIEKIRRIPIGSISNEALEGDYGRNPIEVALEMMKEAVLMILEEE